MIDRRFERVPIKVPLFVTVGEKLYEKSIEIACRDISGGGLAFETHRDIPLDARSRILLGRLGDLSPEASIEGRVVYRRERNDTGRFVIGVEFVKFQNVTREELIDQIHNWSASGIYS